MPANAGALRVLIMSKDRRRRASVRLTLANDPRIQDIAEARTMLDALSQARRQKPGIVIVDVDSTEPDLAIIVQQLAAASPASAFIALSTLGQLDEQSTATLTGKVAVVPSQSVRRNLPIVITSILGAVSPFGGSISRRMLQRALESHSPHVPSAPSPRQIEVLRIAATGASNSDIARQLRVSRATVDRHLANLYIKLSASTRDDALRLARELGWLEARE